MECDLDTCKLYKDGSCTSNDSYEKCHYIGTLFTMEILMNQYGLCHLCDRYETCVKHDSICKPLYRYRGNMCDDRV